MKDLKHTPAPWKFSTETHFSGGAPYSESVYVTMGEETLTIGCHTGTPHQVRLQANANLIAAAPDLLEAPMAMVEAFYPYNPHTSVTEGAIARARSCISKATENATLSTSKTPES